MRIPFLSKIYFHKKPEAKDFSKQIEELNDTLNRLEGVFPENVSLDKHEHKNTIKLGRPKKTRHDSIQLDRLQSLVTKLHVQKEFINVAAHELKSPLTIIKLSLENFKSEILGPLTGEQKKVLERMEANIGRLVNLTEDILSLARLENGRAKIRCLQLETQKFLMNVVENFSELAAQRGLRITVDIPRELPLLCIDAEFTHQVLANLLSNALRFAEKEILVKVCEQKGHMLISVIDDGVGLKTEDIPQLFKKFTPVRHTAKDATYKNTGLGLAICKKIVEDVHRGKIWAENSKTQGAEFHFTLPVICTCK